MGVLASRGLSSGTGAHGPPAAAACAEEEEEGEDEEENVLPILNADVARVALLGRHSLQAHGKSWRNCHTDCSESASLDLMELV